MRPSTSSLWLQNNILSVSEVLEMEIKALNVLGKHLTTELFL